MAQPARGTGARTDAPRSRTTRARCGDSFPSLGAVPVATITRGDVQRLVSETAGRWSVDHARTVRAAIAGVLRQCEDYGELDSTPCVGIRVGHAHDEHPDTKPVRVVSPIAGAALIDAADSDDEKHGRSLLGPFVRLALATGLRRGELLGLPWGAGGLVSRRRRGSGSPFGRYDARKEHRLLSGPPAKVAQVTPRCSATGERATGLAAAPACDPPSSRRRARLCKRAREPARMWAALGTCSVCPARYPQGRQASARVAPIDHWTHDDGCDHVLAPLPTPHDLRHTYASDMLRTGRTARAVVDLLGHADASLVLRR